MKKYLYIYNYSPHEKELCQMEFRQIFHEEMQSKYYFTNQDFPYQRSVFIKGKLDIMCVSHQFEEIVKDITCKNLCYYNFKVIYLKNEITHVNYQESLERCKAIALPIDGSVNMQNPQTVFAITKINNQWIFGIYHDEMTWGLRYHKPYSYSHSLNVRDARTLVNIAVGNHEQMSIVDPCCGIGTVVLEALSMGFNIRGYDINRDVSYQARLNLEHFGYDPFLIERKDIHCLKQYFDVVIMDIPYGVYSPFTYEQQVSLLKATTVITHRLVLVTHICMNDELKKLGYQIVDQCEIVKGQFKRYITLCEREKE